VALGELARQFDHCRRQVDDARLAGLLLGLVLREDPDGGVEVDLGGRFWYAAGPWAATRLVAANKS